MKLTTIAPVENTKVRRVLISVFDKTGLVPFAQKLAAQGVEVLASGGTAKALADAGVKVVQVDAFTQSPEVLGGRVKTLHPRIHAGILAHQGDPEHMADLEKHGFVTLDVVVCNLYPFDQALARKAPRSEMIEFIDIGGPTMVRAAAKNADGGVTILTDPADYDAFLNEVSSTGSVSRAFRRRTQAKAFRAVAEYDLLIARWVEEDVGTATATELPSTLPAFTLASPLRYGENPHQKAALYRTVGEGGVAHGTLLAGKELSYNNFLDMDAAYRAAYGFGTGTDTPTCAIVKHTNPCGLAQASSQVQAFERALAGDPLSAFGGIIGFNQTVTADAAKAIRTSKLFVECIVAPDFSPDALAEFKDRENLRLFKLPAGNPAPALHAHRIGGGMLVQEADSGLGAPSEWRVVTKKALAQGWQDELAFAMRCAAVLKSNAICITKDQSLRGAGAGQMSRVDATEQAIKKAGEQARGAFLASDAFFPFDDSVRLAAQAGIAAIVQPGGSKRDPEVIAACDELGIAMVFTGRRHFRH